MLKKSGNDIGKRKIEDGFDLKFVLENVTRGWMNFCSLIVRFDVDLHGKTGFVFMN
jgi:hypothetical protein